MISKVVAFVLALQLAVVLAVPATAREELVVGHPADSLINSMTSNVVTSSVGETGNVVSNFPSRFEDGGNTVKVSKKVTTYETGPVATGFVGTTTYGKPSVSSSEAVLNELKEQATSDKYVTSTGTSYTSNINSAFGDVVGTRPATVVTRPGSVVYGTSSTWSDAGYQKLSEEELRQQAKNAKYQFATQIDDSIAGNFQQRAEIRENGVVYGKYSYDDGFYFRQTYYEADEGGFRITKEEVLPSRIKTLTGDASVQMLLDGNMITDYHITKNDLQHSVSHNKNMGLIH